jgi:hypothetical protein
MAHILRLDKDTFTRIITKCGWYPGEYTARDYILRLWALYRIRIGSQYTQERVDNPADQADFENNYAAWFALARFEPGVIGEFNDLYG